MMHWGSSRKKLVVFSEIINIFLIFALLAGYKLFLQCHTGVCIPSCGSCSRCWKEQRMAAWSFGCCRGVRREWSCSSCPGCWRAFQQQWDSLSLLCIHCSKAVSGKAYWELGWDISELHWCLGREGSQSVRFGCWDHSLKVSRNLPFSGLFWLLYGLCMV